MSHSQNNTVTPKQLTDIVIAAIQKFVIRNHAATSTNDQPPNIGPRNETTRQSPEASEAVFFPANARPTASGLWLAAYHTLNSAGLTFQPRSILGTPPRAPRASSAQSSRSPERLSLPAVWPSRRGSEPAGPFRWPAGRLTRQHAGRRCGRR